MDLPDRIWLDRFYTEEITGGHFRCTRYRMNTGAGGDIEYVQASAVKAAANAPADPALLALDAVRVAWRHERAGRITMDRTDATAAALDALEATLKATPDGAGCACGQWHSTECYLGAPAPPGAASEGVTDGD